MLVKSTSKYDVMNTKYVISIIAVLVLIVFSCKKEPELPAGNSKIDIGGTIEDTTSYNNSIVTSSVAKLEGNTISQHGHCWSIGDEPTIADKHTSLGELESPKSFTSTLDSLEQNTKYNIRSYLNYSYGIIYGEQISITTLKTGVPVLTTSEVTEVTLTTAKCGGEVTVDSGLFILERGVCWDTVSSVDIEHNIDFTDDGDSLGMFTSNLTGLNEGKTYFVKAYATNENGTSYGEVKEFSATAIIPPEVITIDITEITINSAESGGNVISNGNGTVSARGIVWSRDQNPTLGTNEGITEDGNGIGTFTSSLTSLQDGIFYYVRSYATNEKGTTYGDEKSFQTIGIGFPTLTTNNVINVTTTTASCGGNVSSAGNGEVNARGICWNLTGNPTLEDNINSTTDGTGIGSFNSNLTGLIEGTQYYVVAYATNETGTSYGLVKNFTTVNVNAPIVSTNDASNITTSSANAGGNVTDDGNQDVTQRGVCWSTDNNPTLENNLGFTIDGTGTGTYVSTINDLIDGTNYYFRAYAMNIEGIGYGEIKQFTTVDITLPLVSTTEITDITNTSATSGGNVSNDGNSTVTARGVCWSTSSNPTITNNHTTDGTGTGSFTSSITELTGSTDYYVRAYATNSEGTAYGNEIVFTTLSDVVLPTVITDDATNITDTTATSGGNVTSDGGGIVTARGVCWSTASNPTLSDSYTTDGSGLGSFISELTGLTSSTEYFVRSYATNSAGTAYGNEITFTTLQSFICGDIVNYEGQGYNTVLIGDQCWMKENLNVGTQINGSGEQTDNSIIEKYCYDDDISNCDEYGGLYQWDEMMEYTTTQGAQGICPSGWHIPTDDEWKILEGTVDSQFGVGDPEWELYYWRGHDVAINLKSTNSWLSNGNGIDSYGFTALPGGYIYDDAVFSSLGYTGGWWMSTEKGTDQAHRRLLYGSESKSHRNGDYFDYGFSIRCLKD